MNTRAARLPSRPILIRRVGRAPGLGDLLSDVTSTVNDVTGNSTDTSSTDNTPVETNTSGVSTPIDDSGNSNFVTPPAGPTGLAAVPAWAWVAGAGVAAALAYEFVLKK